MFVELQSLGAAASGCESIAEVSELCVMRETGDLYCVMRAWLARRAHQADVAPLSSGRSQGGATCCLLAGWPDLAC